MMQIERYQDELGRMSGLTRMLEQRAAELEVSVVQEDLNHSLTFRKTLSELQTAHEGLARKLALEQGRLNEELVSKALTSTRTSPRNMSPTRGPSLASGIGSPSLMPDLATASRPTSASPASRPGSHTPARSAGREREYAGFM